MANVYKKCGGSHRKKILKIKGKKEKLFGNFCQKLREKFEELAGPQVHTKLFYKLEEDEMIEIEDEEDFDTYFNNAKGPIYHIDVEYDDGKGNKNHAQE